MSHVRCCCILLIFIHPSPEKTIVRGSPVFIPGSCPCFVCCCELTDQFLFGLSRTGCIVCPSTHRSRLSIASSRNFLTCRFTFAVSLLIQFVPIMSTSLSFLGMFAHYEFRSRESATSISRLDENYTASYRQRAICACTGTWSLMIVYRHCQCTARSRDRSNNSNSKFIL